MIEVKLIKVLQINGFTDKQMSYADLRKQTLSTARALYGAGIRQNDFVAIVSENRIEFPAISFASLCINSVVAPINPLSTSSKSFQKKYS